MTKNLIAAIHKADVKLVEQAIADGADVNAKGANGEIPIHTAVAMETNLAGRDKGKSNAYLQILNLLIQHGADVNAKDDDLNTALHLTSSGMSQNQKVMKLLIDKGADINAIDVCGNTPLHIAAQLMRFPSIQVLVESGTNASIEDSLGRTAEDICHQSIRRGFSRSADVDSGFAIKEAQKRTDQKRARGG